MHPRNNRHPSSYVKTQDEVCPNSSSPISFHLTRTGLDIDDLAASAGLSKLRLLKILRYNEKPNSHECSMLDLAFHFPQGTMSEAYLMWETTLY